MVHLALELAHSIHCWHLWVTACADSSNQSFEMSIGRIIDNPAAFVILVYLVNGRIELGSRVESISFPQLLDLAENLLSIGIPAIPLDRGMESIHHGMDLQARGIVDFLHVVR